MKKKNIRISICSTVHQYDDPRIFHRQAQTLAENFQVRMYICAPFSYKSINNLEIFGLPQWQKKSDRIKNMFILVQKLYFEKSDVYIFHDPELLVLIPFVSIFKKGKIIYDIHENYHDFIQSKIWISSSIRYLVSACYSLVEKFVFRFITMIWYPHDDVGKHYRNAKDIKKLEVKNVPQLKYFSFENIEKHNRQNQFVYVGAIEPDRGIKESIIAFSELAHRFKDYKYILAGPFYSINFENEILQLISSLQLANKVFVLGKIPYYEIPKLLSTSKIGIMTLHPTQNYIKSLPNKLFEYMAMALAVIVSDFPNFRRVIKNPDCGITVNPMHITEITQAMIYLIEHEKARINMGKQGKKKVYKYFNWESEGKNIITAIQNL